MLASFLPLLDPLIKLLNLSNTVFDIFDNNSLALTISININSSVNF